MSSAAFWGAARRAALIGVAGVMLSASSADAQASSTRACLDAIADSALAPEVVYLVPTTHDSRRAVRPFILSSFDLLAQSIAEQMRLPDDSASRARGGVPDSLSWRELDGDVLVTVHRDGTFAARAIPDSVDDGVATGYRGIALILRATEAVARAGEIFPWDADQDDDSLTFALSLTIPTHGGDGLMRRLTSRMSFPVFAVRAPWSEEVKEIAGIGRLHYPEEARRRRYEAEVRMRYKVNATGRVIESTIHEFTPDGETAPVGVNQMMHSQFVYEVRRGIPTLRFQPRTMAGCVVPAWVEQPFTFSLQTEP